MSELIFEDFVKDLEEKLLFQLTLNIKEGRISPQEGKKVAALYLQIDAKNQEDLLKALVEIEQLHPVVAPVISKYMTNIDSVETAKKLQKMHEEIGKGNIDEALHVGKGEV